MTKPSYRAGWVKHFQEQREGYFEVAGWDLFEQWDLETKPDWNAERNLRSALELFYGRGDADLARRYLERCLAIAERTLAEDKLRSPRCRDAFPENRGILLRACAFARALLGNPLEEAALRESSAAFEEACANFPKHKWDDFQENTYLSAIRLALVAGDAETVQRLLTRRRVFRWFPEQDDLFRGLLHLLQTSAPPDESFQDRFKVYFDRVRDPKYKPQVQMNSGIFDVYVRRDMLRLEIGILYDKYFLSPTKTIDWQQTIDAIAE
jgi:hypothetical protein